jgi:hypothetical protein
MSEMKWTSRRPIFLGVMIFAVVIFVVAVAGSESREPAQKVQHVSLLKMLLAVGLMVTGGLLCAAAAVMAVAERFPTAKNYAEPFPAADRPHEHGSTDITARPA